MASDILVDICTVTSPVRMECVHVPAGEFLMGSTLTKCREASKGELPQHRVYLAEFSIGKYPVTNAHAQRAVFVRSARYEAPSNWDQEGIHAGEEDHPVVQISWRDARSFCAWLSEATDKELSPAKNNQLPAWMRVMVGQRLPAFGRSG